MLSCIKKLAPETFKCNLVYRFKGTELPCNLNKNEKRIFVFLCGFYQNLGDMAITYAQHVYLTKHFLDYKIIMVPSTKTYEYLKYIKKICTEDDIITITGGGNMSARYASLENARCFIIKKFPNQKIVSFPQTIDFDDDKKSQKMLKRSIKIYSRHNDLTVFLRENKSYKFFKKNFANVKAFLAPDMVLSLNKTEPEQKRTDVIVCLREDKESGLSGEKRKEITAAITDYFGDIKSIDTVDVALDKCQPEVYEETLNSFWARFRQAKVVITDRLHAMIFSQITGTACVVFDNDNGKISETYNLWLKDNKKTVLSSADNIPNIIDSIKKVMSITSDTDFVVPSENFLQVFNSLSNKNSERKCKRDD